jgi:hypothetical protein
MPANHTNIFRVALKDVDTEVCVTALFVGGLVDIQWTDAGQTRSQQFYPDPFFRKPENYVSSGLLVLRVGEGADRRRVIAVAFANASAANAPYILEITSPRKLALDQSVKEGTASDARLVSEKGTVKPKESAQFVVVIEH